MSPYIIVGIISYLIGSFPTGVVLSRQKYGIDVREMGSGNIGATNITRVFGWYAGFITFIIDFSKGYLPLYLISKYYDDPWLITFSAGCLVIGHCFSIFLKFSGGKGVATSFGCICFVAPFGALIAGVVYAALLFLTKISAMGSLGGILTALIYVLITKPEGPILYLILGICSVVTIKHHSNIRRLFNKGVNQK